MKLPALNGGAVKVQAPTCAGEERNKSRFFCPRRRGVAFPKPRGSALGFLFFLALALPAHARPHVLVILADHLTLADVTRPGLPNFARMRQRGELALMSPGLAQKPDPVATVYATLGAGDSVRVGDFSQGLMDDALRQSGIRTALIGDADADDPAPYLPPLLFLPNPNVTADGNIPDPTAPGGKREDPVKLWAATQAAIGTCDLVILHFGDFARAERENERGYLLPNAYQAHRQRALSSLDDYLGLALSGHVGPLFLVVPTPPLQPDNTWNQLTPFFAVGIGSPGSLTSETTQTPGLIAARDLAPTVLAALQIPAPLQMTGAAVAPIAGTNLRRLDRQVRINQEAMNPIFWTVGVGATVIVFGGLSLYLIKRMTGRRGKLARYGLRLISAWPLALLLAPLADVPSVNDYLAVIAGMVALLALLPSPSVIFGLTALVLVLDGLTGTRLISQSALSEYALSGIRFYGIGNEYMGVLIGGALLMARTAPPPTPIKPQFWGARKRKEKDAAPVLLWSPKIGVRGFLSGVGDRAETLALWFVLVTFVLSCPAFGAKAGGAVTATATFYIAWRRLRGQPVNWKHLLGSILAGFALALLWGVLSHWLHLRRTHLETATDALGQGRFGYIVGVSLRKIGLAARVLLHPGTVLGLASFAALGLTARTLLRRQVTGYLARNPRFAAVWSAGLWGCLVAVLFNDSGIVAAILILQCLMLTLLHGLFGEERDASAQP